MDLILKEEFNVMDIKEVMNTKYDIYGDCDPYWGRCIYGFRHKFNFKPIPYIDPRRKQFINRMKQELRDFPFMFFGEVGVKIDMYFNKNECIDGFDICDYAKTICDGLKGAGSILIDDTQIQSLSISRIYTSDQSYFEIYVSPNSSIDFIEKPIFLYEMPDGMYYPVKPDIDPILLAVLTFMIDNKKKFRHQLRKMGFDPLRSYWNSRYISPILKGFHKSRIINSGFEIFKMSDWKSKIENVDLKYFLKSLKEKKRSERG